MLKELYNNRIFKVVRVLALAFLAGWLISDGIRTHYTNKDCANVLQNMVSRSAPELNPVVTECGSVQLSGQVAVVCAVQHNDPEGSSERKTTVLATQNTSGVCK